MKKNVEMQKMLPDEIILAKIYLIRGSKVMLDRDLALLYGVDTKRLKEAVKRNISRFPKDFMFELSKEELKNWRNHFGTSNSEKMGLRVAPFACYSCISGKEHPLGEYEIESAIEKRDKYGRRHIDEMDPSKIAGIFDDEGYEINPDLIKKPSLCLTCLKNFVPDQEEDILCNLNRYDQNNSDNFICHTYKKM
jgi:ORF6N domain